MTYTPQNMLDIRGFTQEDKQLVEQTIGKHARLSSSSYALYAETYFNDSKQNLSFRTLGDLNKNGLVVPALLKGRALEELDGGVAISDKALMLLTRKENIETFLGETINISGKNIQFRQYTMDQLLMKDYLLYWLPMKSKSYF